VSFSTNWWLFSKMNSCFDDEKDIYFLNNCQARVLALEKLPITRNLDLPLSDLKDSLVYRLNSNMLLWKISNKFFSLLVGSTNESNSSIICIKSKSFKSRITSSGITLEQKSFFLFHSISSTVERFIPIFSCTYYFHTISNTVIYFNCLR
jgi:hypothetical protein